MTTGKKTLYEIGKEAEHEFNVKFLSGEGCVDDSNSKFQDIETWEFTYEHKRDFLASRTGNHFLEMRCNGKPSGILATESEIFVITTDDEVIMCFTKDIITMIPMIPNVSIKNQVDTFTEGRNIPLFKLRNISINKENKMANNVEVKIGQTALTGYVKGTYDFQSKEFKIRRGKTKNGKKYQEFEIAVSEKKEDGWINGQGIKVTLWGDTKVDEKSEIGLIGRFVPDNYEKDGKTIYGNRFMAFEDGIFKPESWEKKNETSEESSGGSEDESEDETW